MPSSQLRILVPLQSPADETDVVRLAASLARPPWGELHLTHVVTPQAQSPPDMERQLASAVEIAASMGIGAIPHLEHGDDVTQTVKQVVARWNCNMVVMEWQAEVERNAILGATNRALAKALDVDTVIYKNRAFRPAGRVLVPTGGGSNSMIGLQIARDLCRRWEAEMDVVRVAFDPSCQPGDPVLSRYCTQLLEDTRLQLELLEIETPVAILPADDVVDPIVERAQDADLVVLGASNDWRLDGYLGGSIPDEIAARVPCSVLMARGASVAGTESLSSILWGHTIRLNMHAEDKWDAITQIVDGLVQIRQIPDAERDAVLQVAFDRERQSPTAMGHATAIPHAPIADLPSIIGAMGIFPDGVDFGGPDGEPTHFVFLLLTPLQNYRSYIPVLAKIATFIRPEATQQALLRCQTPSEVTALLRAHEH